MDRLLQDIPGFGACGDCRFAESGWASLCYTCARGRMERLREPTKRCEVCDLPYEANEDFCRNWLCPSPDRRFEWNFAIAMRSGQLERAIDRYKVAGNWGWGLVFGRVLAGFLQENSQLFRTFDVILPSPTYVGTGEGSRSFDHTSWVVEQAAREVTPGRPWPFDVGGDPVIVKTAPTTPLRGKSVAERRRIAAKEIRPALVVRRPEDVRGRQVLVYDDVFTDGTTLNEVATALLEQGGAMAVCGVSLCRQPWRGPGAR